MKSVRATLKSLVRGSLFLLSKKNVKLGNDDINKINIPKSSLSVFSLSTNPIISFKSGDELFFFRECNQILERHDFFENTISRFFDFLKLQKVDKDVFKEEIPIRISFSKKEETGFKNYILTKKKDKSFYRKIIKTDKISEAIGFNIWLPRVYDSSFFGEFGLYDLPTEFFEIAVLFLWHMRSSFLQFRTRKLSICRGHSFFAAGKTLSSKIVAEELGFSHLIVDAIPAYLVLEDNTQLFGILTSKAAGCRACDFENQANPMLQKELHDLYLLDNICCQPDHGPDNYNVYCTEGVWRVSAFDNDNPYAFLPIPFVRMTVARCSPCLDGKGRTSCKIISKDAFDGIENINLLVLKKRLKPYLSRLQVGSLVRRIKRIRNALSKARDTGDLAVLNSEDWNEELLRMELNCKFGETYLTKLMNVIGNKRC